MEPATRQATIPGAVNDSTAPSIELSPVRNTTSPSPDTVESLVAAAEAAVSVPPPPSGSPVTVPPPVVDTTPLPYTGPPLPSAGASTHSVNSSVRSLDEPDPLNALVNANNVAVVTQNAHTTNTSKTQNPATKSVITALNAATTYINKVPPTTATAALAAAAVISNKEIITILTTPKKKSKFAIAIDVVIKIFILAGLAVTIYFYSTYTTQKYDYSDDENEEEMGEIEENNRVTNQISTQEQSRIDGAKALDILSSVTKAITTVGASAAILALGFRW